MSEKIDEELKKILYSAKIQSLVDLAYKDPDTLPKKQDVFKALTISNISQTKVVILGQDPYYQNGVADGLAFSSQSSTTPASLKNIFKEIKNDYPNAQFFSNDLSSWAKQGVLLLNTSLTVKPYQPGSHAKIGWEYLVIEIIKLINQYLDYVVFILWGKKAQEYMKYIDNKTNLILVSAHPSPLAANYGFFNNHHFKKTNDFLKKHQKSEINWSILNENETFS